MARLCTHVARAWQSGRAARATTLCMSRFDFFIALDGHGLNGFEGFAGVARLRCDSQAQTWEPEVRWFPRRRGRPRRADRAGRHGRVPRQPQSSSCCSSTRARSTRSRGSRRCGFARRRSSTRARRTWCGSTTSASSPRSAPELWRFSLRDLEHPEPIGAHGVTLPHAIKRIAVAAATSSTARWTSTTRTRTRSASSICTPAPRASSSLPATAWHLGCHPTRDVCYVPTQRCIPQDGDFTEYAIAHFKNYLFEIDAADARITRHLAIPKDMPGALTSRRRRHRGRGHLQLLRVGRARARRSLASFAHVTWVNERPRTARAAARLASRRRQPRRDPVAREPADGDALVRQGGADRGRQRASTAATGSGSRRIAASCCRRTAGSTRSSCIATPSSTLHARVPFPPMRAFYKHLGRFADTRLGFHHAMIR